MHSSLAAIATDRLLAWVEEGRALARSGQLAAYIPSLGAVPRDRFDACALDLAGWEWRFASDATGMAAFPLMSAIKPFALLACLELLGEAQTLRGVGLEATDRPFNAIPERTGTDKLSNPYVNSGAIAIAAQLPGANPVVQCEMFRQWLNNKTGANLTLDEAVLASVQSVPNRINRDIAASLQARGLVAEAASALEIYERICCLSGTVCDLGKLGLLLADPNVAISPRHRRMVTALMTVCGLYQVSGEFAARVGIPAKSGVSGAFLAVLPKLGAIACYGPALDEVGNSIAAVHFVSQLSSDLDLSIFG